MPLRGLLLPRKDCNSIVWRNQSPIAMDYLRQGSYVRKMPPGGRLISGKRLPGDVNLDVDVACSALRLTSV